MKSAEKRTSDFLLGKTMKDVKPVNRLPEIEVPKDITGIPGSFNIYGLLKEHHDLAYVGCHRTMTGAPGVRHGFPDCRCLVCRTDIAIYGFVKTGGFR